MLNTNTHKRPSIYQVLKQELIQQRIQSFLTKTLLNDEFSHTIFHKQQLISADGRINKLEAPSNALKSSILAIEQKKSEDRRPQPVKSFDPQIEKARAPESSRPQSSQPNNNYHYKGKGGGFQVGFSKPSHEIPKTRPKYTPPSISEEEQKRRLEKEREREELKRLIEERERRNREEQKKLEKQKLDQWRKDYEEKQKREIMQKRQEEMARRNEEERNRRLMEKEMERRKEVENQARSKMYHQARYEAELNKRRHQEMERQAANNIFGYVEPEPPKRERPSTAAHAKKDYASGDLNSNQAKVQNYHYKNKPYSQLPSSNGKYIISKLRNDKLNLIFV